MRLYVGGLPYQTNEQDLRDLFSQIGAVSFATVITDRDTGRSKGFGFVELENDQDAHSAIDQLNGTTLGNRTITFNQPPQRPPAATPIPTPAPSGRAISTPHS